MSTTRNQKRREMAEKAYGSNAKARERWVADWAQKLLDLGRRVECAGDAFRRYQVDPSFENAFDFVNACREAKKES